MKNHIDMLIFHTAICAGASQISPDGRTEIAYANFCSPRRKKRSGMGIKMFRNGDKTILQIQNLSKQYEVKQITIEDIPTVYELCKGNPYYYKHMKMQPTIENLMESMIELPTGKTLDDKYFVGFWEDDSLVAILDLIIGYPNEDTAFIGWFMMNRDRQGNGIGSEIVQEILACIKNLNLQKVRLAYIKDNRQAKHFWLKNGFKPTGEEADMEDYTIIVLEREL